MNATSVSWNVHVSTTSGVGAGCPTTETKSSGSSATSAGKTYGSP
jgi:hypothetical protein